MADTNSYEYEGFDTDPSGNILFSGTNLTAFASGIYNDLMLSGSAFGVSYIASWLNGHIGEFNVQAAANFNICSGFALPPMNYMEVAIYQEMFTAYYYRLSASNLLGASQYDWTRLTEADSTVVKVSRNELAKTYRNLAQDSQTRLRLMTAQYRMNNAQPLSVIGDDTIPAPFSDRYNYFYGSNYFPYCGFYFIRADVN